LIPGPAWLAGSGLPHSWSGRESFVVLDTGFGDGSRFLAAWRAWQDDPARARRLYYLALTPVAGLFSAAHLPAALQEQWPLAIAGVHRIMLEQGEVVLDLLAGEAAACLRQSNARADLVFFGPCGDALQTAAPMAQVPSLERLLARQVQPGAVLVAAALAASSRDILAASGFVFSDSPAAEPSLVCATMRNMRNPRQAKAQPERRRQAIVIGAGLAGAAACERLAARGWQVTLVERHPQPACEASGNLAGIFMPQLSLDDNPAARLSRAAFLFALRRWRQLGGVGHGGGAAIDGASCGVLQLARDAAHGAVQEQIAASGFYPDNYARWLDAAAATALLGSDAPHGGWLFEQGGWAHPGAVCRAMLDACGSRLQRVFSAGAARLVRIGDDAGNADGSAGEWQVLGADGGMIAQAPVVVLASGTGALAFGQAAGLPLAPVRGQVTHLRAEPGRQAQAPELARLLEVPLVVCGEAYLTPVSPATGLACAGATYDEDNDASVRSSSQHDNLARLAAMFGLDAAALQEQAPLAGRTGFRCVAPDRLPLVGALPQPDVATRAEHLDDIPRWPGLFGLLGFASRGLIWTPLAAELLASQLEGEPAPLESGLVAALDPARFLLRELRRSHSAKNT
jgi:tRNA 5-methylaminomethyl-2-thiouridine biosynthesis bifunctional protein